MLLRSVTVVSLAAFISLTLAALQNERANAGDTHAGAPNTETMAAADSRAGDRCTGQDSNDLPFRISVDGVPLDADDNTNDADSQRCTDIALSRADIQVRYDSLDVKPRLNVHAAPDAALKGDRVLFSTYSNYQLWLDRAEVRIFAKGDTTRQRPLDVVPVEHGIARWQAPDDAGSEVTYVLRVYDPEARFDETAPKVLKFADIRGGHMEEGDLAVVYGGDSLKIHNIPLSGGTVLVSGTGVAAGHRINVMGTPVPVDANGDFAIRQILSPGPHQVEVAVLDDDGVVSEFSRSANIPDHDFFYVALADLTLGRSKASGAASLLRPDKKDEYNKKYYVNGRLAFYLKGKIRGEYLLTAAADTREQPIRHLFTNFDSKDPRFLLRNLDPNKHYPVYGDDSTTRDDAPTRGKFYVRLERGDSDIMWGNFKTSINGTEFVRYERGLYGARARLVTDAQTQYGERRGRIEAFAAQPGTIGARDVFRGTGGSHYYLQRQNITQGSERATVEIRDKNTGLVLKTRTLTVTEDFEINYLQGRITLRQPLASVAEDEFIVQTTSLSGHEQYLVVTYEFAPGLDKAEDRVAGGRASYWLNDHIQFGSTGYNQREPGKEQKIIGADVTLRYKPGTYIKLEGARSNGGGSGEAVSLDGGFTFNSRSTDGRRAWAKRVEAAVDLNEIMEDREGRLSAYWQEKDRGFSGPGQLAVDRSAREMGAKADVKIAERAAIRARADEQRDEYRVARSAEVNIDYSFNDFWMATLGARMDDNAVRKTGASETLNRDGARTDIASRLKYTSGKDWSAYVFGQATAAKSGRRKSNNRLGFGGEARFTDKWTVKGEVSTGDGGLGAKVGTEYTIDDKKTVYLNYTIDTDSTEIVSRGGEGVLTTGARVRFSDNASVFGEERWRHGDGFSGLTHAYGLDLVLLDHWKAGIAFEYGEIRDEQAGDIDRLSVSTTLGYGADGLTYTGKFEFRDDKTVASERETYLTRNSLGAKMNANWRFIGRLNGSYSNSSLGDFYDGNFAEGVAGFAYRPVENDRLNLLFKYSFLYELPSAGQITGAGIAADFSQRSHVVAIDGAFDLTKWLTVGGKYAYRMGELRDNRVGGPWFDSEAQLAIGRLDLHIVKKWDLIAEARVLDAKTAGDKRIGALIAAYRHFNDNVKFGVGYNFTDFSDDITNLDYNNKGVFVNAVAKF